MLKKVGIYTWRTAVQKGAFGGNRTWMTIFATMATVKVMRRIAGSVPEPVFRAELKPGESFIINHLTETHG